jgi:hypothetical protein
MKISVQLDNETNTSTSTAVEALILRQDEVNFIHTLRGLRLRNDYSADRVLQLETHKLALLNYGIDCGCNPYALQRQYEERTLGLFRTTMYVNGDEEALLAQIPN